MNEIVPLVITGVLGGGVFKAGESIYRAWVDSREKKTLAEQVGARTPAEIESVSVKTMTFALTSAETRIRSLEAESVRDRERYEKQIAVIELERETDKKIYQDRILELTEQLQHVRSEMEAMERKLAELLAETHQGEEEHEPK